MSSVVIIPTTGAAVLEDAVHSVLAQSVPTHCYVVCDGEAHRQQVTALLRGLAGISLCVLPRNTGANGYNGHRIYAAFAHLVDEDFVFFLDQDNWYAPTHVQRCVALAQSAGLAWVHSLRNIVGPGGQFICRDDCESLGKWPGVTGHHVDTSAFCVRRQALVKVAHLWHGNSYEQDRLFTAALMQHFPQSGCTGAYTLNYRLGSTDRSVRPSFFEAGNRAMAARVGQPFPWAAADADAGLGAAPLQPR